MSERLLMLCPYWPPMGGPGVQRAAKFAQYLPENGVTPFVLTRAAGDAEDSSLSAAVGHVALRTAWHAPLQGAARAAARGAGASRRFARLKQIRNWLQVPDHAVSWVPFAVASAMRWSGQIHPTALFSTSPYHSVHLAGLALRRRLGVPWIADFRDPWVGDLFTAYPTAWHRRFNAQLERAVVNGADAITVISASMARDFAARYPEAAGRIEVIYNGYDEDDFSAEAAPPAAPPWIIRHMGTFYPDRKPDSFLHALARHLDARPHRRGRVRVELIGRHHPDVEHRLRALVGELHLGAEVVFRPYVAHTEAVTLLKTSHALLLVPGPGETTVTGKIFEYLAARRPLLAVAPFPSGIDEVLAHFAANPLRADDTPEAVEGALDTLFTALEAGNVHALVPAPESAAKFSRRASAGQLANLIKRLRTGAPPR